MVHTLVRTSHTYSDACLLNVSRPPNNIMCGKHVTAPLHSGPGCYSPQRSSSEKSPQSLSPLQMTPLGPAGTQRPFRHWNSPVRQALQTGSPGGVPGGSGDTGEGNDWAVRSEGREKNPRRQQTGSDVVWDNLRLLCREASKCDCLPAQLCLAGMLQSLRERPALPVV